MTKILFLLVVLFTSISVNASPIPVPPNVWAASQTPPYYPKPAPGVPDPSRPWLAECYSSEAAFVNCQYQLAIKEVNCEAAFQKSQESGLPVVYECFLYDPI